MSAGRPSDTDLLLAHGAWVRALARKLVSDEHRAEDLAQDTWVAALSHPGPVRSPRSWLGGILANLVRSDLRGRGRRERRETEAARDSATASTVESAALGRDLANDVLALDEPFRTTILLRYYEDLPPRAIARRMGVPVRTVGSRLARGLERLRTKLRRDESGAWLPGLVLLARRPGLVETARDLGTGVLWMNAKQIVTVAAAIAVTAGALVWMRSAEETPAAPDVARPEVEAAAPERKAASTLAPAVATGETRVPEAAPAPAGDVQEIARESASTRRIRGRVFGPEALPLSGIEIEFRGGGDPPPRAVSRSGGAFEIEASGSGDGTVLATDPRLVNVSVGRVRAGREVEAIVVVAPARDLAGKVVDASGAPLPGVQLALEPPDGFMRRLDAVMDSTERSDPRTTSDGSGAFSLPRSADIVGARIVGRLEGFDTAIVEVAPGTDLGILIEVRPRQAEIGEITGIVVDATDVRVPEAYVSLGQLSAVTDSRGEFRLETDGAEEATELVAIRPGLLPGRARAQQDLASGKPIWPANLVVRLGAFPLSITGTVVDGDGKPRKGVRMWIDDPTRFGILGDNDTATVESLIGGATMEGDNYWRTATSDEAGRFELSGLLEREYQVGLLDAHTLDLLRTGPLAAGERDVRIVFERSAPRRIAGRVISTRGVPVPGVSLDLMRPVYGGISTSIDTGIRLSDAEGRFAFEGVHGTGLRVWVRGDDVVPAMLGVPDAIGEEGFLVRVAVRCHFKVHLASGLTADRLRVLDPEGAEMDLMDITPSGVTTMKHASIVDGRSAALGVAEQAATLSVLWNGEEVLRRDLRLAPGILNVIEL